MTFCTRCGKQIEEGQVCSCSANAAPRIDTSSAQGFFVSMKNRMGIGDPERNSTDCYERGQRIVPDNINPTEGEVPVKQYNIAVLRTLLKFERAEGRMQVTNKRVIFRAPGRSIGGRTTMQHEYAIDEIAGIEAQRNFKFSFIHFFFGFFLIALTGAIGMAFITWCGSDAKAVGIILGILLWLGGLVPFFLIHKKFLSKLLSLGVSLGSIQAVSSLSAVRTVSNSFYGSSYSTSGSPNFFLVILVFLTAIITLFGLFLFFMRPNLVVTIKNKMGVEKGPVDISIRGTFFLEVMPTNESERAIREIGAMINDIQKLGDFGIEKWVKK